MKLRFSLEKKITVYNPSFDSTYLCLLADKEITLPRFIYSPY
jgi:hypothetical protein